MIRPNKTNQMLLCAVSAYVSFIIWHYWVSIEYKYFFVGNRGGQNYLIIYRITNFPIP